MSGPLNSELLMFVLLVFFSLALKAPPPSMPNECKIIIALISDVNRDLHNMNADIDSLKKLAKQIPQSAAQFNGLISDIDKLKNKLYKQRKKFIFELLKHFLQFP